jgi:hypothetical protein
MFPVPVRDDRPATRDDDTGRISLCVIWCAVSRRDGPKD